MTRFCRLLGTLAFALVLHFGCAEPHDGSRSDGAGSVSSSAEILDEVGEGFFQLEVESDLWMQNKYGVEDVQLPDLSHAYAERRSARARELLERLEQVDALELDHSQWVTLEIIRWDLGIIAEQARFHWLRFPITRYNFKWLGVHDLLQSFEIEEPADAARYLELVGQYSGFLASLLGQLEGQLERSIALPRTELDQVVPSWQELLDSPSTVFPALSSPPEAAPEGFQGELAELYEAEVRPLWQRLVDFLGGEYSEAAPEAVGLYQYPGGKEYYAHLARASITTDLSPEEIHRLGLERITAVDERQAAIRGELGFEGSRAEFRDLLATDPRLYAAAPEEVHDRLMAHVERLEPQIDAYFERLPKAPYQVTRLDPDLEATMTYGYYDESTPSNPRGTYYFNGSQLDQRSLLGAASLIYHELFPGHHLQVALQNENETIPDYRRESWHYAFGEGWAEYASMLAEEMGMYADPWDLYGRLSAESFFATRLVVDTGMNHFGWSRERAREFMRENTLSSDTEIETETLRYAVVKPAQALGYGFGSLEILRLREHAQSELGEDFDIRRFHSALLDYGSMPLAVLERHVDWFIEQERSRTTP